MVGEVDCDIVSLDVWASRSVPARLQFVVSEGGSSSSARFLG